jgi:hypothetical protein
MVLPSEYLPAIWGEDFCFDDNSQATAHASLERDFVRVISHAEGAGCLYARDARRR